MKIKVKKSFLYKGKIVPIDSVLEYPDALAYDVIARGRAERVVEAPKAPPKDEKESK